MSYIGNQPSSKLLESEDIQDGAITAEKIAPAGTFEFNALTVTNNAYQEVKSLTDTVTIVPDFSLGNNFTVTLGGNRTLGAPINLTAGQSGIIVINQDATGSRTLAFNSVWKFPDGEAPSLSIQASDKDVLIYFVLDSSNIISQVISDLG